MAKSVLMVEDSKMLSDMYQRLLTYNGYTVKIAMNGEDGLKIALADHPDLILLDVQLPKISGMEMLKLLRNDQWGKDAKVIILSNQDPTGEILQGVVTDHPAFYLVKANTEFNDVLKKIREVLGEQKVDTSTET